MQVRRILDPPYRILVQAVKRLFAKVVSPIEPTQLPMEAILLLLGALAILPAFFSEGDRRPRQASCYLRDAVPRIDGTRE